jgi:hypothetical protein
MPRAGNFGSAAVAIPRSHSGGGAPPRPPARYLFPDWFVLSRRGADSDASLGRRSWMGSKREPNSRGPVFKIAGFMLAFCENFAKASRTSQRILRLRHPASVFRLN